RRSSMRWQDSIFAMRAHDGGVDGLEVEEEGEHANPHRQRRREEESHRHGAPRCCSRRGRFHGVQEARKAPFGRSRECSSRKRKACVRMHHQVEALGVREEVLGREG
ncbi:MAG: hypothetical protein ACK559_31550, partial [bacterium]